MRWFSNMKAALQRRASRLHRDQRGIESIEYLLIAALVIIAAAAAWRFLGQRVAANVNAVAGAIDSGTQRSITESGLQSGTAPKK